VAALGYFVDIYDLILFSIVRIKSLKGIGVPDAGLLSQGVFLLNMQMAGMLTGGILWGVLGDKKGRLSVLFGSIFLYSAANIANAFVQTVPAYALLRFVAGIGLAGELGAGITLVSEVMPKETRGYGTMIVATIGILGAVVAALVGDMFDWRVAYMVGGGLGVLLLFLRIGVYESGMFNAVKIKNVRRGSFSTLFRSYDSTLKYICCILVGAPIWFVIGILITFSPEFGKALGLPAVPDPGRAVMLTYLGLALGDFTSGSLAQVFKSRKKTAQAFIILTGIFMATYLLNKGTSMNIFYANCLALGFAIGYWAVFVTIASEQFGTNIRSTVTTTVPNFVRGSVVPLTFFFQRLKEAFDIIGAAAIVGVLTLIVALVSTALLDETHGKDLDYVE
jgi:MFS family permease